MVSTSGSLNQASSVSWRFRHLYNLVVMWTPAYTSDDGQTSWVYSNKITLYCTCI
jgi:hypothetical protein